MRMFGKFLVYANLVLSLIFLAWAVALYTQRLDWAPHKNIISGEITPDTGRLHSIREEIKDLIGKRDLAEARWTLDSTRLPELEARRKVYQKWYTDQLALAQTGRDTQNKPVNPPVIQLVRDPNDNIGMLIIDPKQRQPVKSREQDVKAIDDYVKEYQEIKTALDNVQAEINKLVEEKQRLTTLIAGEVGKSRGVRGDLEARINYKRMFDDEMKELKPKVVSQRINLEQQKRRLVELEARMKELNGDRAAR